jgi:xanthine phosphoribosyltransferase
LAEGNAALGLIDLCKQAGASVVGVAIVIEKGFQGGRKKLEDMGIHVESAAIIDRFEDGKVILK